MFNMPILHNLYTTAAATTNGEVNIFSDTFQDAQMLE